MATVTIRKLPEDLVDRIKVAAAANGRSLEQELREALSSRYASRAEILDRAAARWEHLPAVTAEQIDEWIETGRE